MKESELQRVYNYKTNSRESMITTNKPFVNIDNGSMGGTQWTCFIVKDNKSYYFVVNQINFFLINFLNQ